MARCRPSDKLLVVSTLQKMGHVVAVTGDGVNDAPALRKVRTARARTAGAVASSVCRLLQADIGVAMGNGGTDVARESAEIILTDNSFASIVLAIEEGRAVYSNIKKFLTYILASNTAQAVPFIFFIVSAGRCDLTNRGAAPSLLWAALTSAAAGSHWPSP